MKSAANPRVGTFLPEFMALLILMAVGCCPKDRLKEGEIRYLGPTMTLAELVSELNARNTRMTTLWARGDFQCRLRDDKGNIQNFGGELLLAHRKPGDLKMYGQGAGIRFFDIGTNSRQFWMWIPYEKIDTMWWGELQNVNQVDPDAIPVRPDLIVDVLGINNLDPNLLKDPIPALRFNPYQDAYMVTFHMLAADRMVVQKEVWYDRATLLPRLVMFYDIDGRLVLRAELSDHRPLDQDESSPKVASHFALHFLQTDTKLVLKLAELKETNKGTPNDRTFRFPGEDAAAKTYKVDEPAVLPSPQ